MEAILIRLAISAAVNYLLPRVIDAAPDVVAKIKGRATRPKPSWSAAKFRAKRELVRKRRRLNRGGKL